MTWDNSKNTFDNRPAVPPAKKLTASEWNNHVADQKGRVPYGPLADRPAAADADNGDVWLVTDLTNDAGVLTKHVSGSWQLMGLGDASNRLPDLYATNVDANDATHNNSFTDPSGTTHTGEIADNSDISSIQSSSDVDHDSTTGGTDADAHHSKTTSASDLTDVSADSVSGAHHAKYTDSDAQTAINNDADHGSTASHNYATSASDLSDVSADSDPDAHHAKYTDSEARSAVEGTSDVADLVGDAGTSNQVAQTDGSNVSWTTLPHGDLTSINTDDHHAKYTDSDAQSAINNDTDHGSTASHNYATSASDLSDVSADSDSDAHHTKTTQAIAGTALTKSTDTLNVSGVSGAEIDLSTIAGDNITVDGVNDELDASSGGGSAITAQEDGSDLTTDMSLVDFQSGVEATNPTGDEIDVDVDYGELLANNLSACQGVKMSSLDDGDSVEQPVPVGDTKTLRVYRWGGYNASDGSTPTNLDVELLDGSDTVQKSENTQDTSNASGVVSFKNTTGSTSIFKLRIRNETGGRIGLVGGHFGYRVI